MKVNKNILNALLFNSAISNINCCLKKNKTNLDDSPITGDTNKTSEEEDKKSEEEDDKNKEKTDEEIKKLAQNTLNVKIEQPKGNIFYDEFIKKKNEEVEKRNAEEIKNIQVTDNGKGEAKFESINQEFSEDPCVGLQNIGATCYMNATLQCFSHISRFVDYFKYKNNPTFDVKSTLSSYLKTVFDNLWKNVPVKKNFYIPRDFKDKISEMNPLFQGVAANDSKDLFNFIIMTLHEELNKPNNDYISNDYIDQRDPNAVFKAYVNNFVNSHRSIISDLFYGTNCSITQCSNCGNQLYNYQIYSFLNFPLEEVRKYNNEMYNSLNNYNNNQYYSYYYNPQMFNNFNNNTVNIYDCFNYDRNTNNMSGSNDMYCNYCKVTCQSNMRTVLTIGPEVLVLILNRGKGKQYDVKILFDEELDLTPYITCKNTGIKYKLIGVITHIGGNGMDGHFIASCKDPINGKWNRFNDAIVTEVTDFKKEVVDFAMPYILFYEKVKEK